MTRIRINPPPDAIGRENVIYGGTARRHYVAPMSASVSIKAVLRGQAVWESGHRQFLAQQRIALAARLLQLTSSDVTEIAAKAGYESLGSAREYSGGSGLVERAPH